MIFVGLGTSRGWGVLEAGECQPTFGTPSALVQAAHDRRLRSARERVRQPNGGAETALGQAPESGPPSGAGDRCRERLGGVASPACRGEHCQAHVSWMRRSGRVALSPRATI